MIEARASPAGTSLYRALFLLPSTRASVITTRRKSRELVELIFHADRLYLPSCSWAFLCSRLYRMKSPREHRAHIYGLCSESPRFRKAECENQSLLMSARSEAIVYGFFSSGVMSYARLIDTVRTPRDFFVDEFRQVLALSQSMEMATAV
jgi:hypothetical protein